MIISINGLDLDVRWLIEQSLSKRARIVCDTLEDAFALTAAWGGRVWVPQAPGQSIEWFSVGYRMTEIMLAFPGCAGSVLTHGDLWDRIEAAKASMSDNIDLSRTAKALAEHDAYYVRTDALVRALDESPDHENLNERCLAIFRRLDELAEAVGIAYGEDTKDRNDPETCRQCVRPGSPVPAPGTEESFVRRMVRQWQEQQTDKKFSEKT